MWAVMWGIQLHAQGTKKHIIQSMNHAGFVISYNQILKVMKSISDFHKSELRDIGKNHQAFIAVYDNFEQTLGVQDQRSDHNKEFFSVTTCQFLTPMWMPKQGLRQSMFNQAHLLDWTEILYHPGNRRDTEFAKGVCDLQMNNLCIILINLRSQTILSLMLLKLHSFVLLNIASSLIRCQKSQHRV